MATLDLCACRLQRAVRELNRQLDSPGAWEVTHVDRALGEIGRLLSDKVSVLFVLWGISLYGI